MRCIKKVFFQIKFKIVAQNKLEVMLTEFPCKRKHRCESEKNPEIILGSDQSKVVQQYKRLLSE